MPEKKSGTSSGTSGGTSSRGTSKGGTPARGAASPGRVYQLKVVLSGSRPPIWRRFQVPEEVTLGRLHTILQILVGWEDRHFHLFASGRTVYRPPVPDLGFPSRDERKVPLSEVLTREKERILYEYDFRDGWEHTIVVEKILPPGVGPNRPVCLAGKRSGPPEESGGVIGYERLLATRRYPEDFNPEAFDLEAINRRLARLR